MPTLEATCSLDLGCPVEEFTKFCDAHPDHTVVYANTSAAVKARADWVVTSSCAVEIIEHLDSLGEKLSGHRISIWGAISKIKLALTCCFGMARVSYMKNSVPVELPI